MRQKRLYIDCIATLLQHLMTDLGYHRREGPLGLILTPIDFKQVRLLLSVVLYNSTHAAGSFQPHPTYLLLIIIYQAASPHSLYFLPPKLYKARQKSP